MPFLLFFAPWCDDADGCDNADGCAGSHGYGTRLSHARYLPSASAHFSYPPRNSSDPGSSPAFGNDTTLVWASCLYLHLPRPHKRGVMTNKDVNKIPASRRQSPTLPSPRQRSSVAGWSTGSPPEVSCQPAHEWLPQVCKHYVRRLRRFVQT